MGENTQIQLIDLYPDATTVDMASGLARMYNNSDDAVIKMTTPFGYVVASGGTVFDLYVGDDSMEVIAVRGNVDFVHDGTKPGTRSGKALPRLSPTPTSNLWERHCRCIMGRLEWRTRRPLDGRMQRSTSSTEYLPEPIRDGVLCPRGKRPLGAGLL